MIIQRYSMTNGYGGPADATSVDHGDYVLHTDYAALEARCAEMERERDALLAQDERREMYLIATLNVAERAEAKADALQAKLAAAEEVLRHTCKHLCQWKDACEVGCPVSAALADTTTDEVQP